MKLSSSEIVSLELKKQSLTLPDLAERLPGMFKKAIRAAMMRLVGAGLAHSVDSGIGHPAGGKNRRLYIRGPDPYAGPELEKRLPVIKSLISVPWGCLPSDHSREQAAL